MNTDTDPNGVGEELHKILLEETGRDGAMSFARFMELVLYHPRYGYYTGPSVKFGQHGDFITAPELGPLFARCVANQCEQILRHLDGGEILEFGAGSGRLACDLLLQLQELQCLPQRYCIMEPSAHLSMLQQQLIKQTLPHLADRVYWIQELNAVQSFKGVILGNEVLDAMPVYRFRHTPRGPAELRVNRRDETWAWYETNFSTELARRAADFLKPLDLQEGYESELHFIAEDWLATVAQILQQGSLILIDYGFPQGEYYHPQRDRGTLMCHYRHHSHTDPFIHLGRQDITSHVNFSSLAQVGVQSGLELAGYTSQAYFLIANGLEQASKLDTISDTRQQLQCTQEIKKLTLPNEMGELFKVIAFNKFMDLRLNGFTLYDHRHKL